MNRREQMGSEPRNDPRHPSGLPRDPRFGDASSGGWNDVAPRYDRGDEAPRGGDRPMPWRADDERGYGYGGNAADFDDRGYGYGYGGRGSDLGFGYEGHASGRGESAGRAPRISHRGKGPKGFVRSDERLREKVCEVLADHHDIDASDIEVEVKDGEVTLTGTVDARATKRLAERVAEEVGGIVDVHNHLQLKK